MNENNKLSYQFEHLPAFASYLMKNLEGFTHDLIELSFALEVPLLKYLSHFSREELQQISMKTNAEFLTDIQNNNIKGHIETSTAKWLLNQLEIVGKFDIEAQDITLINYTRGKTLKHWIQSYTSDFNLNIAIRSEIDEMLLFFNTTSIDAYIGILQAKINEEAYFSTNIINASPGIIFIYDLAQQKEVYINGQVEAVTGYKPQDILSTPNLLGQLTHLEDQQIVEDFFNKVINDQDGKTHNADYRFKKDGNYQWLRCYAGIYKKGETGNPTHILGAVYEITNEKEIAITLKKREQQLLEAQALGKIGSYDWDIINETSESTPEVRKIFEIEDRQPLERFMEHVHVEDQQKVSDALKAAFESGHYSCEYRYMTISGVEKVIDSKGVIYYDDQRRPLKMVGTIQDVTERKKIEEKLIKNALELERSNAQLEEFAYVASHDLKEPLRKIGMFSNIIMTSEWDTLPEKTKANVQKISDSARRMQELIEGILSYSLVNEQSNKEPYPLDQLLQEALSNLEYKIKYTNAIITADALPTLEVIPFQMQQLFQNLISNSIKFSKDGIQPDIKITSSIVTSPAVRSEQLQHSEKYLHIQVKDNGIGFGNELSEKIFGLFKRLHSKSAYEGSGLGLAICRRIVENHGGLITATSKVGEGSTFTIVLPYGAEGGA
jgi:PAS domain S-box-containing protein